jgi:hypothetical protein
VHFASPFFQGDKRDSRLLVLCNVFTRCLLWLVFRNWHEGTLKMKLKKLTIASMLAVSGLMFFTYESAHAQAVPNVFTAPTYKTGAAIAEGVSQTLIRRGFAANDPRILATVTAIGSRTAVTAAAAGAGATMLGTIARLNPYITGAMLIYQGINWYLDSTGKVTTQPTGTVVQPIYSNGLQIGQLAWTVSGGYWGSPQEAISYVFSQTINTYPNAVYSNVVTSYTNSTTATIAYNWNIPTIGSGSATKGATAVIWNGTVTCPAGSGFVSGTSCTGAGLQNAGSGLGAAPVQSYTLQQAYNNLPSAAQTAALSPDLAAETANRLWRDAAAQPDYQGVPWSAANPTANTDFTSYQTAQPALWPTNSDWGTTSVPSGNPITSPDTNPNKTTSPSTATKVDLGADPGTPSPTLEDVPTNLFKPISDLLTPWTTWQVPNHSGTCPTWQASPSIAGHVFSIDLSYHCTFMEQYRGAMTAAAFACWLIIAAFIVLSA